MATQVPPASKKQRRSAQLGHENLTELPSDLPNVRIRLESSGTGEQLPQSLRVPGNVTTEQLEMLVNQLLSNEDNIPYEFALAPSGTSAAPTEIKTDLYTDILKPNIKSTEDELVLIYTPRAVFRVRNITRSSGIALGHGATILTAKFAPHNSGRVATGAGDCTARIWNSDSGTPMKVLSDGHGDHVLCVEWSPDGSALATASRDAIVKIWDSTSGEPLTRSLQGHSKFVTALAWEPLHLVPDSRKPRLASASKDGTVRIWDSGTGLCEFVLSGHTSSVSCVRWGGFGHIYTGSHDKTLKVWNSKDGRLVSNHPSHAHWINHIALSTDYALRSGPFGPTALLDVPIPSANAPPSELRAIAKQKFELALGKNKEEHVVTASDDFTMFLWQPLKAIKPIARLTGHQKLVNHVAFSPDTLMLASASFDNSVKLWDGKTGKFIASLRGHVSAVYQCAWSADSRLLASCSKDTTLKVWDMRTRKLKSDLPGHKDEVFAVDWSVDGSKVVSGSKDKTVRFWTH